MRESVTAIMPLLILCLQADSAQVYIPDVSGGQEKRPVSCVNFLNNENPDHFEYTTVRTREPNVVISMEPEFLVSCSCTDNCTNRSQCECWQLTIEEARAIGETQYSVGYFHHRLRREQLSAYVFSSGATGSRKHICHHTFVAVLLTGYTMFGKTYYHGSLLVCRIVLAPIM